MDGFQVVFVILIIALLVVVIYNIYTFVSAGTTSSSTSSGTASGTASGTITGTTTGTTSGTTTGSTSSSSSSSLPSPVNYTYQQMATGMYTLDKENQYTCPTADGALRNSPYDKYCVFSDLTKARQWCEKPESNCIGYVSNGVGHGHNFASGALNYYQILHEPPSVRADTPNAVWWKKIIS